MPQSPAPAQRRITIERSFQASIGEVWDMWTTPEGIASWFGADGFSITVHELDLRPGGLLRYAMTAVRAEEVSHLEQAGMALTMEVRITYVEVSPPRKLTYTQLADFMPGVAPYDVAIDVELLESTDGTRLVLTIDAMHEPAWTEMAVKGWQSELDKLDQCLSSRAG